MKEKIIIATQLHGRCMPAEVVRDRDPGTCGGCRQASKEGVPPVSRLLEMLICCKAGRPLAHWAGRLPVKLQLFSSSLYPLNTAGHSLWALLACTGILQSWSSHFLAGCGDWISTERNQELMSCSSNARIHPSLPLKKSCIH